MMTVIVGTASHLFGARSVESGSQSLVLSMAGSWRNRRGRGLAGSQVNAPHPDPLRSQLHTLRREVVARPTIRPWSG